jgi:endogenous inhibitor of DNA gyrase (YacG/DUF329 family)
MKHKCPICKRTFSSPARRSCPEAPNFPFCSERCKLIDLGAWLDSEYKVTEDLPDTEDTPRTPPQNSTESC